VFLVKLRYCLLCMLHLPLNFYYPFSIPVLFLWLGEWERSPAQTHLQQPVCPPHSPRKPISKQSCKMPLYVAVSSKSSFSLCLVTQLQSLGTSNAAARKKQVEPKGLGIEFLCLFLVEVSQPHRLGQLPNEAVQLS
jgi:hypothetical protein